MSREQRGQPHRPRCTGKILEKILAMSVPTEMGDWSADRPVTSTTVPYLARAIGVSVGTARTAIRRLESEGAIRTEPDIGPTGGTIGLVIEVTA